jgi:porphobilinogen synthase
LVCATPFSGFVGCGARHALRVNGGRNPADGGRFHLADVHHRCAGADVEIANAGGAAVTLDGAVRAAEQAARLGIPAICLFPYTDPALKTETCEEAWNPDNLSNRTIRAIKAAVPDVAVMTDVALDPYNANGHDGLVHDGVILNDETVEALVQMALAQAEAGPIFLGPSDMMDGRIGAMRARWRRRATRMWRSCPMRRNMPVGLLWAVPRCGRGIGRAEGRQEDLSDEPRQPDEALRLVARDLDEGADMVMVKPGMPYLDICREVKDAFGVPTFAYQVSGRICDVEGRDPERLGQGGCDAGKPDGFPARRAATAS